MQVFKRKMAEKGVTTIPHFGPLYRFRVLEPFGYDPEEIAKTCPVCEEVKVVLVSYVFGPRLPAFGRCITSRKELKAIAQRKGEFTCYVVEVCPACSWNHLARTFLLTAGRGRVVAH